MHCLFARLATLVTYKQGSRDKSRTCYIQVKATRQYRFILSNPFNAFTNLVKMSSSSKIMKGLYYFNGKCIPVWLYKVKVYDTKNKMKLYSKY